MNRFPTLLLLVVVTASAVGYAFYQQYREQAHLNLQLNTLELLLTDDNDKAEHTTGDEVKGMRAAVLTNRNQPKELAVLATAESVETRADSLAHTLRNATAELLRTTGNLGKEDHLPHPNEASKVAQLLGQGMPAQQKLQQQLADFTTALHRLHPNAQLRLSEPEFDELPVVAAISALAQLESEVRLAELSTLKHLAKQVGARRLVGCVVAMASAESSTVAPEGVYRAHMFLVESLGAPNIAMHMRCNSQPVPVTDNGLGQVRFVAARKPGPATWTGTIGFRMNGRDTTFQIQVPYLIARR